MCMDKKRSGFNHVESFFEIEITPDELRKMALEMEHLAKSEFHLTGQVIRYKISSKFALLYRPEKQMMAKVVDSPDTENSMETQH
jgi:hypothetical protein